MTTAVFVWVVVHVSDGEPMRTRRGFAASPGSRAVFQVIDLPIFPYGNGLALSIGHECAEVLPAGLDQRGAPEPRRRPARHQREAGLVSEFEARRATIAVFAALKAQLSLGEADDVVGQLPKDLKAIWEGA